MLSSSSRDPKKVAQKSLAAAIAASALWASAVQSHAQTTGGGIGAAVNSNPTRSSGTAARGTTGAAGGNTAGAVAAPDAPASPVRPGSGPGINNTGSPALPTPPSIKQPIGGATPGPRGVNGTSRLPGSTVPGVNTAPADGVGSGPLSPNGSNPAGQIPGNTAPRTPVPAAAGSTTISPQVGRQAAGNANMWSGQITNWTQDSITFQRGTTSSNLQVTPRTTIQMNGRPISIRDIPPNAQVQIERSPSSANMVQRIVVIPQAANANGQAGAAAANDLNAATPNGSIPGNDINAGTGNPSVRGNDINSPTPNGSLRNNDINSPTPNGSVRNNDINSPTPNGSLPGNDLNNSSTPQNQGIMQNRGRARTDGSQFLGPASGQLPERTDIPDRPREGGVDTDANREVTLPKNGNTNVDPGQPALPQPYAEQWDSSVGQRLGTELSASKQGVELGDVRRNSIAGRSGFLMGDRIESINGTSVQTPADLARVLRTARGEGRMTARILREGTPRDITLSLPNSFYSGLNVTGNSPYVGPAIGLGNGLAVTPDGNVGVGVGGVPGANVVVPAGEVVTGVPQQAGGATAAQRSANRIAPDQPVMSGRASNRDVADVGGTSRASGTLTTQALKVPDVNLGWDLKATPEGVVLTELVGGGIASKSKLEGGDVIESIDERPVTSPGAVAYELHRHKGGTSVRMGILRGGKRMTLPVRLPDEHQPLLLNRSETFGAANNDAKEEGATPLNPVQVTPTQQSLENLQERNRRLKEEVERLKKEQDQKP